MIKDLISDLAYDKINLSQALSRSKLLAYKISNDTFKEWLRKELEGYDYDDDIFPEHRRVKCQLFITHSLPTGQKHSKPVMVADGANQELYEEVNYLKILEPISIIEQQILSLNEIGYIHLTPEEAYYFTRGDRYQKLVVGGYREIGKGQFQNVIELTKQKLLDTLLELDNQFPNLTNEFAMTKENEEKVQNIITNYIYGDNNATNIATGKNVEQSINVSAIRTQDEDRLKSYGVTQEEIEELKKIVKAGSNDKPKFIGKAMKWLGSVTASIASKGLYENIPAITEFIHKIIN